MDELFDMNEGLLSPLDEMQNEILTGMNGHDNVALGGVFDHDRLNPFDSGFDAEHPYPTYDGLRNAGFSDYLANQIANGSHHCYSDRELFECLYNSDDPVKAYNEMMDAKAQDSIAKTDKLINDIETEFGL